MFVPVWSQPGLSEGHQDQNNVPRVPKLSPFCPPQTSRKAFPSTIPSPEQQDNRGLFPILFLIITGNKKAAEAEFGRWARLGSPSPPDFPAWAQVSDAQDQITQHSGQDIIPYYQFHANSSALPRIKSQLKNLAFQGERKLREEGVFVGFLLVGNISHKEYR